MINKLLIVSVALCFAVSCQKHYISEETIIFQLKPPAGWSVKKAVHSDLISYKIARDSGYAMINLNREKEYVWGRLETKNLSDASRLLKIFTVSEIKKIFEDQESSENVKVTMISAINGNIGKIPVLIIDSEYDMGSNHVLKIEYYIIKTNLGWVVVGLGCRHEDYLALIPEMHQILSKITYQ